MLVFSVLSNDVHVLVEHMRLLCSLREWLLLHQSLTVKALFCCNLPWSVIIVFHIGDDSAKSSLRANDTSFRRISEHVAGSNHHFSAILLRSEILLHMLKFLHVLISRICRLSNGLCWLKSLFVSNFDLLVSIFSADQCLSSFLEWVTNRIVARSGKEHRIACSSLAHRTPHIGWVNLNLFDFRIGHQSR